MSLSWQKVPHRARWRCVDLLTGNTVGFVQKAKFSGEWDAYICTGKPWPKADKIVNRKWPETKIRPFYRARADVKFAALK